MINWNTSNSLVARIRGINEYTTFGSIMEGRSYEGDTSLRYRFGFNTQEKDDEVYGDGNTMSAVFWEYDARLGRRWNLDPQPQIFISDYSCFKNNPIMYDDVLGDEAKIVHRQGLFKLFKKETLTYKAGTLYKADGSIYSGKVKGFLRQTVNSLNTIRSSKEGGNSIEELERSTNVYTIMKTKGGSEFIADNIEKAHAIQWETDPSVKQIYAKKIAKGTNFKGGAGGTIYFNPKDGFMTEQGGAVNRPQIMFGHEIFHALDANRGLSDKREHLFMHRSEWQACYRENIMRMQLGLPLRTHYKGLFEKETGNIIPQAPNILNNQGNPIKPYWYK